MPLFSVVEPASQPLRAASHHLARALLARHHILDGDLTVTCNNEKRKEMRKLSSDLL
jgi:hypothetical protein